VIPAHRISLKPLLPILACPQCGAPFHREQRRLVCKQSHRFSIDDLGIPLFDPGSLPRTVAEKASDEDEAAAYAGMRSFAAEALGSGESEGLYRTVSDLLHKEIRRRNPKWILDLGCGAGRTLVDAAGAAPRGRVIGVDKRIGALTIAFAIARLRGPSTEVDLRQWGLGQRVITGRGLPNVFLLQANALRLPFATAPAWKGFDVISCVNLLDRVESPDVLLDEAARVLAPGGLLVLTSPLNWRSSQESHWERMGGLGGLQTAIEERALSIEQAFDGLVYREILDRRRSATDWRVAVVTARGGEGLSLLRKT
jgi:SAM-dependent methyltransferase